MPAVPHPLGGSPDLLARTRENYSAQFPDKATVLRVSSVNQSDDFGEQNIYEVIGVYPANHWKASGGQMYRARMMDVQVDVIVSLLALTDVNARDRIEYEEKETGKVHQYSVTDVPSRSRAQVQNVGCAEYPLMDSGEQIATL